MKLIVGLGNPGSQYEKTRHNAGFMVVDRLARRHFADQTPKGRFQGVVVEGAMGGERCVLLKPATYMNRSGGAVAQAAGFYKIDLASDLLVFVDDVALPLGSLRIRTSGSAGGHNGLTDIQRALGSESYPRCRIGIDARPVFMEQADYVLGRFTPEEWDVLQPAIDKAADAAEVFVREGAAAAMNRFNTKASTPSKTDAPKAAPSKPPALQPSAVTPPAPNAPSGPAPEAGRSCK
jgi:PTH1 family peptidyl-tRNA hydrolase